MFTKGYAKQLTLGKEELWMGAELGAKTEI